MAKQKYELPEIHRINGAVTGTPLFSYDKETYHTTPEAAANAYQSHMEFWEEVHNPKKERK